MNTSFEPYLLAAGVFVGMWIVLYVFKKVVVGRLVELSKKTENKYDDILINVVATLHPLVLGVGALAFGLQFTTVPAVVTQSVSAVFLVAIVYQVSIAAAHVVDALIKSKKGGKEKNGAMSFIASVVKVLVWTFGGLVILSNLGVNITSLIAGLGIGGVAIAFALQQILGDLFSSFAIQLDKPFEVGDFIVVAGHSGIVEKIGIKTTRIRALQGEEIVISNSELTSAHVQNFKKLKQRRVSITFGVLYETPHELLKEIPALVTKVVEEVEDVRFDRVHLDEYGASSIDFALVYYALTDQFAKHMDIKERVLFGLKEVFDKKGIEFAYPTQTLYVKK